MGEGNSPRDSEGDTWGVLLGQSRPGPADDAPLKTGTPGAQEDVLQLHVAVSKRTSVCVLRIKDCWTVFDVLEAKTSLVKISVGRFSKLTGST